MTSQTGQQMILIHMHDFVNWKKIFTINILPCVPRSKGNQTTKFGQLIEYNMKNIFLEKSYTKFPEKISHSLFSKKSKLDISLD